MRVLYPLLIFLVTLIPSSHAATSRNVMVATASGQATEVAIQILTEGGNAVDAAIAAQWVLNVVEPQSSGIGGGGFFLYFEKKTERIYTFDGRETAPEAAHPEMFFDENGTLYSYKPDRITGGLPVGVPGTLKLLKEVHSRFGSGQFSFEALFNPAIDLANNGFVVSDRLSSFIDSQKDRLKLFPDSSRIFLDSDGNALQPGTMLYQPELAGTFESVRKNGVAYFYEGGLAEEIVQAVTQAPFHPGLMSKNDLFFYRVVERPALMGTYRNTQVFSMGPPSSGGSTLIEMLNLAEGFDLKEMTLEDGAVTLSEIQRVAFEDRNRTIADPDKIKIDLERLISKEFADQRRKEIISSFDGTVPFQAESPAPGGMQTSHISIVDNEGNMVSFTTTIEHVFGSALMVPGRGFFLNNELTDFDGEIRNEKGELKPNAPDSGKRPRSSMTPTFVFRDGKPLIIVGSPGGSTIIGTVFNLLINIITHEMTPEQAIRVPKIVNRAGPMEIETPLFQHGKLMESLAEKNYPVEHLPRFGNAQMIHFDVRNHVITGVSDPRGEGKAKGY